MLPTPRADLVANTLDFPFSPVQMIGSHLPPGLDPFAVNQIKAMAGIATLVMLVLSVNLFGDWLRDALNPRLR